MKKVISNKQISNKEFSRVFDELNQNIDIDIPTMIDRDYILVDGEKIRLTASGQVLLLLWGIKYE